MAERFVFEFCPDNTEQQTEITAEMKQYGNRLDEGQAASICERVGVRCRVLRNGSYSHHIFEDGSNG